MAQNQNQVQAQPKKQSSGVYYARIIGTLFAIATVVGILLALVNSVTKKPIEDYALKKKSEAIAKVMPDAEGDPEVLTIPESFENAKDIKEVALARDADGQILGYCVTTGTNGNDGEIQLMVGIDVNRAVTKVSILSQKETMYTNKQEGFVAQYDGRSGEIGVTKGDADDLNVQAISGATISSKAINKGVNSALAVVEAIQEGGAQ